VTREIKNIAAYAAPFAVWIALQTLLPATAWAYAARSLATLVAFVPLVRLRRDDISVPPRAVPKSAIGLVAGAAVCVMWIAPDHSEFYRTWLCWPIGSLPPQSGAPSPYDPAVCGWWLTIAKLVGSAFVIAPVEELFFRSYLYRRLQSREWTKVSLSRFDLTAFLWTVALFSLEHNRIVAALAAGVVYQIVAMRAGIGSAITAHVTTNLALGFWVIYNGAWAFW
jgi:CAAX prenyl protease-like protein